jgi:nitroreductase
MEFKEVIGSRRSIRYYQPWRPVEREKIQTILEAARLASRAVNADWAKAIVVYRDDLAEDDREALKTATTTAQLDLAPVWIFWFADLNSPSEGHETLRQLFDVGALTPGLGWSYAYIEDVVYPQILGPIAQNQIALAAFGGCEAGLAICQALLAAVDEGLGTQLTAFTAAKGKEVLGFPDHWFPLWIQLVGYPAESADAGGQRPRKAMGEMFCEGKYGNAFEPDEAVTAQLKAARMIQESNGQEWRAAEVRGLARMFGLPE